MPDVLIIGGGGAGCSAALHLALRGADVVLLERGLVGGQASGVNYGGVRQQGRHAAELPIARRSHALWHDLPRILGTDCEFEVTGHLKLARDAAEEAALVAYLEVAREHGLALRLLGRNSVHEAYPWLGPGVVAGSFAPQDGAANPRLLAPALARAARAAGATLLERAEVVGLAFDGGEFVAEAQGELHRAPWLLNCAGYWGGKVAATFGEAVPVSPMSPLMLVSEPLPWFIEPNLGVVGGNVYLRQIRRGNVIFGGGRGENDPEIPYARALPGPALRAMRLAAELVPALAGAQVIRSWSGIDGEMPDHLPVIGPSGTTPRLLHAFGFSGHGFQLGLAVGAMLAELVFEGRTDVPLDAFNIGRFALTETSTKGDGA